MYKLLHYMKKVRGRPLGFLIKRLGDIPRSRLRWMLDMVGRSPYRCTTMYKPRNEWNYCNSEFFFTADDISYICGIAKNRTRWKPLVSAADRISHNNFEMFGHELHWDQRIGWHEDPTKGFEWPCKFHSRYGYYELIDIEQDTDIKIPWEMSRLQFLPVLAMAYRLTSNTSYISKLHELLMDWHCNNRVGWGIGWVCTMDVSLRAISLIWVVQLMKGTMWLESNALLMKTILTEHGRFIYRNVEYSDINGNHHVACLLGLLYLGLALRGVPEASKWLRSALEGLQREIALQTYGDGVCHEGSIPYHRLVTEMFLHAGLICSRNHISLEPRYWQRLEAMLDFVRSYTKPNGEAPLFGDGDDGRVIRFGSQEVNDHRYLLALGAVLFRRADMKAAAGPLSADALWLMGREGIMKYDSIEDIAERREPASFPSGGYWILRNKLGDYVIVDCGDVGLRGRGGHGHHDTLSIEANLAGYDTVVDVGCFTYSASKEYRRKSISAKAHNAVIVDGKEPAPIREHGKYGIASVSPYEARVIDWTVSSNQCSFTGEHLGYNQMPGQVTYQRTVSLDSLQHRISLSEMIGGCGVHHLTWRFHLAPQWTRPSFQHEQARTLVISECSGVSCVVEASDCVLQVDAERSEYYPSYGVNEDSWTIVFDAEVQLPYQVVFTVSLK